LKGFKTRVENEIETLKPADCKVRIAQVEEPSLAVWRGLKNLTFSDGFSEHAVTQAEW
jgi:actin-related protein